MSDTEGVVVPGTTGKPPFLSSAMYDKLKWVAQILLPALGTLYAALGALWGFQAVTEVVGSIVAVDAFLGALLSLSSRQYERSGAKYDGAINVVPNEEEETTDLNFRFKTLPDQIVGQKEVVLKVNPPKSL